MTTGGFGITLETAQKMKAAGIKVVSVSVDGLEATHDRLRGKPGSWQWAFKTMNHLQQARIPFGCNTQINRLSAPEFPKIYERLRDAGISAWQIPKNYGSILGLERHKEQTTSGDFARLVNLPNSVGVVVAGRRTFSLTNGGIIPTVTIVR